MAPTSKETVSMQGYQPRKEPPPARDADRESMPEIETTLLRLARYLQGLRVGLSIAELCTKIGELKGGEPVTRVTARRYRTALLTTFGDQFVEETGKDRLKRIRLLSGASNQFISVSAGDLAELHTAIAEATDAGLETRAKRLRNIAEHVQLLVSSETRRALEIDLPDILAAEGYALRPGPRPKIHHQTLSRIREAMAAFRVIKISYESRTDGKLRTQYVRPHGLIFGHRHYLVAFGTSANKPFPHTYAIANILSVEVTSEVFERNPEFDIRTYAQRSFGIYQQDLSDVVLRFDARRAEDVVDFFFHPTQKIETLDDGRVEVRFTASGLVEMAWHMFTWAPDVEIVAPTELREEYRKMLEQALSRVLRSQHVIPREPKAT